MSNPNEANDEQSTPLEDDAIEPEEIETSTQDDTDLEDDDLAVLRSSDEVVASASAMAAVTQGEDFMLWNIEGLYDEATDRPYKSRYLKQNPPVLHIENQRDGETFFADFVLTREYTRTLAQGLRTTHRAYSGVTDQSLFTVEGIKARLEEFTTWVKDHWVGVSIAGLVMLFIVVFGFLL